MAGKNILLVEGNDDVHVVYALRDIYNIDKTAFSIQDKKGITNLLEGFEVNLIEGSAAVGQIGIIVDADQDLNARWQQIQGILRKADYENIPDQPAADGTIIEEEFKPTVGVWIMPDNQLRGYLETFLTMLVPDSEMWEKARAAVAGLDHKPFVKQEVDHTTKAEIHTYLAWQEDPGRPFGVSITARYLRPDTELCVRFTDWLKRLFVD